MTVTSTTAISGPYDGNDATVTFDYTFVITEESELKVTLTDEDGVDTVQTLTTHYSVTIGDDGTGTFTMVTAPATGEQVTATMQVEGTQETDLLNYGAFNAEVIEDALDKLTRLYLQLSERVDRCLKLGQSDESDPEDVTLANFTQQAYLDTDNFSDVLSSADTSIQDAFETIDAGFAARVENLIGEETGGGAYYEFGTLGGTAFADQGYDYVVMELTNVLPVTDGAYLCMAVGSASYYTGAYHNVGVTGFAIDGTSPTTFCVSSGVNDTEFVLMPTATYTQGNAGLSGEDMVGRIRIVSAAGVDIIVSGYLVWENPSGVPCTATTRGKLSGAFTPGIKAIKIYYNSGNIASGTVRLWGIPSGS